jgi:hypothetical protein
MKQALKNPNLYYIAVPSAAAFFALLAAFVFYPGSVKNWQDSQSEFKTAQEWADKLIALQPERLSFKPNEKSGSGTFDFTVIVDEFAKAFTIAPTNYTTSVKGEVKKQGKRARSATLSIKSIDIEKLSKFLSTMLARWPDLECDVLSLDKGKAGKDDWKADMTLTYYY